MKSCLLAISVGGACFAATAAFGGPPAELAGPVTFATDNDGGMRFSAAPDAEPQGCVNAFYDSGNAMGFGVGRTVGTSSGWEVYQPFMLTTDYTLCAIATDGWYVTGSPTTFRGSIFPDVAGTPDIANPLTGADFQLSSDAQNPHFVKMPVAPVCLRANTLYYFGARATGSHWSAIFFDTINGGNLMPSFSIQGGNFGQRFSAPGITLQLFGEQGCGSGCPSDYRLSQIGTCSTANKLEWSGAPASPNHRLVYNMTPGSGSVNVPGCGSMPICLSPRGIALYPGPFVFSGASGSTPSFNAPCGLNVQLITPGPACKKSNAVTL